MAIPTQKSPEVEAQIDAILPEGRTRRGSIEADTCTMCGKDAKVFKDQLSINEYKISGMCQECQDKTFGSED